ncbi:cryptococcal mannosyltransferase 1-domain-containing protein [Favolaschia claudopus]|uniref:Cryptococcal mannosyltransferase 1-domain-containing protein n=1 Tax=Favolaschia claudopus TaxID=2862362 RepID=A0AAW0CSU8_9AGAR
MPPPTSPWSWTESASSHYHRFGVLALLTFASKVIFRLLLQLTWKFAPALCYALIFYLCRRQWLIKMNGIWPPAFPLPRTMFVLFLVATPLWGLAMTTFYSCRWLWTRRTHPKYSSHELPIDLQPLMPAEAYGEDEQLRVNSPSYNGMTLRRILRTPWILYLSLALFGLYMLATYEQPVDHRFKSAVELANRDPRKAGYAKAEKIFIAAMFHDNALVLPYWIKQVTKLIHYLGPNNVFVSIVESYSSDDSPVLLDAFDEQLKQMNVARRILTRDTALLRPPSMATALPRINFLSATRNRVLEPLLRRGGYERVLFSNDVFVEAEAMVELLNTNGGQYDMACGLDLSYWGLYDQWVIRDRLGRIASTIWPYFLEDAGFKAVMADQPAPVYTCWNGIAAIAADPFLPPHLRRQGILSESPLPRPLPANHPSYPLPVNSTPAATPPLRFRPTGKNEPCFSSESFNLPYDLRRVFDLKKIYVNPRVINSYVWEHYVWFKYFTRHWAVKWWIESVENGSGMHLRKLVLGNPDLVWQWEGGECHPGF